MNRLDLYPGDPNTTFLGSNNTLDLMGQETGHQWLAFVDFDNGGVCSNLLLGRQLAHWSFFHDTDASDMEGNRWQDNGNGTFTSIEATARFSPLDQYMMGLRSTGEVPTFFFINNPTNTGGRTREGSPQIGVTVNGTRQNATVNQVITCEGARSPSSGFSGVNPTTTWKQGFILLIPSGTTAPNADIAKIDTIRSAWVSYFNTATGGRGSVDTALSSVPVISVTPGSQDFGNVVVGGSADRNFTVQNAGGGTLSGSASTSAPFSIVAGGSYSLGAGASQNVTVRFSPTSVGTFLGNVTFTGGGGATRTVTGTADNDVSQPDFVVTSITLNPASPTPNSTFTATVTVKNQGTASGSGGFLDVWANQPSSQSCVATGDQFDSVGTLAAGASSTFTFAGLSAGAAGSKTFRAFVDSFCSTTESNEGNNQSTLAYTVTPQQFITVTAPNGGESWKIGTTQTIQWTSSGISGNVKIEISRNGGPFKVVSKKTPNDGSHPWKVTKPATTKARIRVCSLIFFSICDTSDADFTIRK